MRRRSSCGSFWGRWGMSEPTDWENRSLVSLGSYINGYAFKPSDWKTTGLPIVRIAQITGSADGCDYFDRTLAEDFKLQDNDIVFSWSGTLAVVRWHGGPAWLNQHLFRVIPAEQVDRNYLFHVLQHAVQEMDKRAHGSTMKHIKRGELAEYSLMVPTHATEQSAIARILDTLDTQIEKTQALVAKLEQVKEGLLHDLLTRGVDENGELRPSAEEAPELYKESALGLIPRGWVANSLSSCIAKLDAGVSVNAEDRPHGIGEIGVLKTSALYRGAFVPDQNKAVIRAEVRLAREQVLGDSILVSRMNTPLLVGASCYVTDPWPSLFLPDRIWQLKKRAPNAVHMRWLAYNLQSHLFRRFVDIHATGTSGSMKNLPKRQLLEMPLLFPPMREQIQIADRLASLDDWISSLSSTMTALQSQKSGLMDDLLTGRVRVTPLLDREPAEAT